MSESNELTNLRAENARLREALTEQLGFTPGGACQVPLIPHCCCGKCKLERAEAALSTAPVPDLYCIENRRSATGNYTLWWRVNGAGYTCNLNEAWRVPKAEAERICRCRPEEDFMWPCAEIGTLAERHVDVQRIGAARNAYAG